MIELQTRKRLLLAESEINRAVLGREFRAARAGFRALLDRGRSLGSILSSTGVLAAGLAAWNVRRRTASGVKSPWASTLARAVGLVSAAWLAVRPRIPSRPVPGSAPAKWGPEERELGPDRSAVRSTEQT